MEDLLVSVTMITYNHEEYIIEAMESVLMQEVNFDFELIVVNDKSPDNTDVIVKNFLKVHPKSSIVKYIKHRENIGMIPNFIFALEQCQGKYTAICEGDDYWTDPHKLQKQVDLLEKNAIYAGCGSNVIIKYENNSKSQEKFRNFKRDKVFNVNKFLSHRPFHTASFIFRTKALKTASFPTDITSGDRLLFIIIALTGPVYYINEVMCCYRKNDSGVSSRVTTEMLMKDIKTADWLKENYPKFQKSRYLSYIHRTILSHSTELSFRQMVKHILFYFILSFSFFPFNLKSLLGFAIIEFPNMLIKTGKTEINRY